MMMAVEVKEQGERSFDSHVSLLAACATFEPNQPEMRHRHAVINFAPVTVLHIRTLKSASLLSRQLAHPKVTLSSSCRRFKYQEPWFTRCST